MTDLTVSVREHQVITVVKVDLPESSRFWLGKAFQSIIAGLAEALIQVEEWVGKVSLAHGRISLLIVDMVMPIVPGE